jgi:dipeptidyl aminopeptidase/acylaminoacyl peptidase
MSLTVCLRGLSMVAILLSVAAEAKPIPAESLARLSAIQSVSMSADGKQLVAVIATPDSGFQNTALATWNLEDLQKGPVVTPSGDRMKFIGASALKADKVLVFGRQEWSGPLAGCGEGKFVGSTDTFVVKPYLTDGRHSEFEAAFEQSNSQFGMNERMKQCMEIAGSAGLVSNLPLDPSRVVIQRIDGISLRGDYFTYDLETGDTELLLRSSRRTSPGLFHPRDGHLLTKSELEQTATMEYESRVYILDEQTGEFELQEPLTTQLNDRYSVSIVGRDDASGKYYVLTDQFSDMIQARLYDPKAKAYDPEPLLAHPKYNIAGLVFGNQPSNFNQVIGYTVSGLVNETTYVEGNMRSIHDGLKQAYKGRYVNIIDYNNDLSKVLFTTSSAQEPTAYHLLLDRQKVQTLGSERPWVSSEDVGEQRWITYTARDGLEIPAILDLPAGWSKEDGPIPTVIHPHGGPWARDFGGWDWSGWVPFLTSRGYAVMRPQFRGSQGLGRKLWLAGDAEWGKAMQDDKDDGAQWLVEQGIADPEKLVIFGYSYGGFAAAAATVRPGGPFRCAIAGAPVTDLGRLGGNWSDSRLQRILQGTTVTGMDPIENTDKASIPILIIHGDRDVRVPDWHGEKFYKAVKDQVPARYVSVPDMPHSAPWYYRHQMAVFEAIENFLREDCGPGGIQGGTRVAQGGN